MKTSSPAHVIFGTGVIGIALMRALQRRGQSIRMVNRSGRLPAFASRPLALQQAVLEGDRSVRGLSPGAMN
jgi:ketopantoate reductase